MRILVAAPYYHGLDDADEELRPNVNQYLETLSEDDPKRDELLPVMQMRGEALATRELLWRLERRPDIEIRQYCAHRYNTILRFDDQMITVLALYAVETAASPHIYTQPGGEDRLFESFLTHFDAIWARSHPFSESIVVLEEHQFAALDPLFAGDARQSTNPATALLSGTDRTYSATKSAARTPNTAKNLTT